MLTRRSFLSAASAVLSLVGVKLPEAKATADTPIDPLPTDALSGCDLILTAKFCQSRECRFTLPFDCCLAAVNAHNDRSQCAMVSVGSLTTGSYTGFWLPKGEQLNWASGFSDMRIFRKGEEVIISTSQIDPTCKMMVNFERVYGLIWERKTFAPFGTKPRQRWVTASPPSPGTLPAPIQG